MMLEATNKIEVHKSGYRWQETSDFTVRCQRYTNVTITRVQEDERSGLRLVPRILEVPELKAESCPSDLGFGRYSISYADMVDGTQYRIMDGLVQDAASLDSLAGFLAVDQELVRKRDADLYDGIKDHPSLYLLL